MRLSARIRTCAARYRQRAKPRETSAITATSPIDYSFARAPDWLIHRFYFTARASDSLDHRLIYLQKAKGNNRNSSTCLQEHKCIICRKPKGIVEISIHAYNSKMQKSYFSCPQAALGGRNSEISIFELKIE